MRNKILLFWADSHGSAAIEYSLVAGALALALIAALVSLTETLNSLFQTIVSGLATIGGTVN